jgi:hypothetical protein
MVAGCTVAGTGRRLPRGATVTRWLRCWHWRHPGQVQPDLEERLASAAAGGGNEMEGLLQWAEVGAGGLRSRWLCTCRHTHHIALQACNCPCTQHRPSLRPCLSRGAHISWHSTHTAIQPPPRCISLCTACALPCRSTRRQRRAGGGPAELCAALAAVLCALHSGGAAPGAGRWRAGAAVCQAEGDGAGGPGGQAGGGSGSVRQTAAPARGEAGAGRHTGFMPRGAALLGPLEGRLEVLQEEAPAFEGRGVRAVPCKRLTRCRSRLS